MTSLTSLKHHTKIEKSKTESVLNFFPPLYVQIFKKGNYENFRNFLASKESNDYAKERILKISVIFEISKTSKTLKLFETCEDFIISEIFIF